MLQTAKKPLLCSSRQMSFKGAAVTIYIQKIKLKYRFLGKKVVGVLFLGQKEPQILVLRTFLEKIISMGARRKHKFQEMIFI